MAKGYLALANGMVFEGTRFGAEKDAIGELVFTTQIGGYIETLTDACHAGQIVMHTFPLIGNYGMIEEDIKGKRCAPLGYVVREWCEVPSNFRAQMNMDEYLRAEGVPGLCGVDTRQITRVLCAEGPMNAAIAGELSDALWAAVRTYEFRNPLSGVRAPGRDVFFSKEETARRAVLIHFGETRGMIEQMNARGVTVVSLPHDATPEDVMSECPGGLLLSDGPGDPAENAALIGLIESLAGKMPIFGIGLGHQLLALGLGGETYTLPHGHRGANQPVRRVADGWMFITSQNHGYAVAADRLPRGARISHINANDGTIEGLEYPSLDAFSVQFIPEYSIGPRGTSDLFDRFADQMR